MLGSVFAGLASTAVAPLAGSVDRNICCLENKDQVHESLPSRGAWIEIRTAGQSTAPSIVAPLAGSVDRNYVCREWLQVSQRRSPRGERG